MRLHNQTTALIAVLSSACGPSDSTHGGQAVDVVDSLGITVVTNHTAENLNGSWRLGNVVTSIGAVEGDSNQLLGIPVSAIRLESGHYAVSDQMLNQIRVYDTAGEHVFTRGRSGEGPAEYQGLGFLLRYRSDSTAAVEIFGGRISVLGPDLAFGRVFIPRPTSYLHEGFRAEESCCRVVGTLDRAFVVQYPDMIPTTGFGVQRSTVTIVRLAQDGTFMDTLGTFESAEYHPTGSGSGQRSRRALLSNRVLSVSADHALYVTDGRTYEVKAFGRNGTLRRIFRLERPAQRTTDEIKAQERAVFEARVQEDLAKAPESAAYAQRLMQLRAATPYHETVPTITTMLIDRGGNLWVAALFRWTTIGRWEVFDPTGRWLATVEIPSDLRVFEIGDDYVIALFRDELDVPFVRVYELLKS